MLIGLTSLRFPQWMSHSNSTIKYLSIFLNVSFPELCTEMSSYINWLIKQIFDAVLPYISSIYSLYLLSSLDLCLLCLLPLLISLILLQNFLFFPFLFNCYSLHCLFRYTTLCQFILYSGIYCLAREILRVSIVFWFLLFCYFLNILADSHSIFFVLLFSFWHIFVCISFKDISWSFIQSSSDTLFIKSILLDLFLPLLHTHMKYCSC